MKKPLIYLSILLPFFLCAEHKPSIKLVEKLPQKMEEKIEVTEVEEAPIENPQKEITLESHHLRSMAQPSEESEKTPDGFIFDIIP